MYKIIEPEKDYDIRPEEPRKLDAWLGDYRRAKSFQGLNEENKNLVLSIDCGREGLTIEEFAEIVSVDKSKIEAVSFHLPGRGIGLDKRFYNGALAIFLFIRQD